VETVKAIFNVLVVGLLLGAGLPAIYAIGIRLYSAGSGDVSADGTVTNANPALKGIAYLLFAIIAAVILAGILWITRGTIDYYFGVELFPFAES
jgi:hypothetical protein